MREETIPTPEKVFSLFEPHTERIQKGKQRPNVELGHRLLLATDLSRFVRAVNPFGQVAVPVAQFTRK